MTNAPAPDCASALASLVASKALSKLAKAVSVPGTQVTLASGVNGSLLSFVTAALTLAVDRPLVLLLPGETEAEELFLDLSILGVHDARLLPPESRDFGQRLDTVTRLAENSPPAVLVTSVRAAIDPVPAPSELDDRRLVLRKGDRFERDDLIQRLADAGLQRVDLVERRDTYSVRGDVVDLFVAKDVLPLRVEFFGEHVEGLRRFEPSAQLSVEILTSATILLASAEGFTQTTELNALLPDDVLVISRDEARQDEALAKHLVRLTDRERGRAQDAFTRLVTRPRLIASSLKSEQDAIANFGGRVVAAEGPRFEEAMTTLERVVRGRQHALVGFDTEAERDRFNDAVREHFEKIKKRPPLFGSVVGRFSAGFHAPYLGIAAVNHHELFATARTRRGRPGEGVIESRPIDSFVNLDVGDYVVHMSHGIARFDGMEVIAKGGAQQDFLALTFKDDLRLLVPAVRIDLVQRYIGGRGEAPELSKLGGRSWEKRKAAAERAVTELAAELLEVEARRARLPGISHPADSPWQQEFEAAFPYELTPDQASAVEQIKVDMESSRPMDRLLCGDVGFGKTEVALRAAFKCVMGGRQVAILVPTTVLAQQHLQSFQSRMGDYPVEIGCLSRFQSKAEQKRTVVDFANGAVDIVIGTHRIVQDDVVIKNLGLLIVDEEQRFGVTHKEKIRRAHPNVDLLTLTATPIPRTLNQALLGIRDISSLETAPLGRQAIHTEVCQRNRSLIRSAILRELDREGQIYFIHNRVQTIHKVAAEIIELVPEARVLVGHGQMPERQLEQTMLDFIAGDADVLVATTIVESGLDIPRANTLFVDSANHYGLADLHQLRGRVGRYRHQAYAYFMVDQDAILLGDAEKRLRAIEEFARLGSGFQIAMRDMEIRGVGNILGAQQSGHIAAIGYDLYCRLLDAAVKGQSRRTLHRPLEVELNVDFTAFLPDGYIPSRRLRIEMYRKLGRARVEEDFVRILSEMSDRFGPPPEEATEFFAIARLRGLMERLRIRRLEIAEGMGPVLTPDDPKLFLRHLVLHDAVLRPLAKDRFLIVPKVVPRSPRALAEFLASVLVGGDLDLDETSAAP